MYGYNHSFCLAERCSAGQNDFLNPEELGRTPFCPAECRSARQNAVLPGRTIFATRRCQIIYIGDIYIWR